MFYAFISFDDIRQPFDVSNKKAFSSLSKYVSTERLKTHDTLPYENFTSPVQMSLYIFNYSSMKVFIYSKEIFLKLNIINIYNLDLSKAQMGSTRYLKVQNLSHCQHFK